MASKGCEVVAVSAATTASILNGFQPKKRAEELEVSERKAPWQTEQLLKSPEGVRREATLRNQANTRFFLAASHEAEQNPYSTG